MGNKPMRDMTSEELAAWNGLIAGKLMPLADVLDGDDDALHPIIRRWLVKLIRGSLDATDYRLVVEKHPDLSHAAKGPRAKRVASLSTMGTALKVVGFGGLDDVKLESAVQAVMTETGQSRRTVMSHWAEHKHFLTAMLAHKMISGVKKT